MAWEAQAEVPGGFADEAGLVAGLRAGRGEAFEALHAAYAARIYGLALRIVDDPEEAQDVAQEVLLKVFRGLPGDDRGLNLPAWLYRVTVNTAFDHVRARKRRPVTVADESVPEAPAAVDEYERAELARRVESTLRELPKRQQIALVLRDVHGLSVGETATVLGLKKGSTDVLLSRARAGFRRVFLAAAGPLSGRCERADEALAAGVGRGKRVPASLLEHSRTCPDCRRAVELWGAAPVGLGLLLPQVALPAKLSLGATLAAAQAAGIAVPAGLGVASAAGAASSAVGASAAATTAASAVTGAAGATAGAAGTGAGVAGGAGLLAALGSAAGVKIATLAAVATAAAGIAGVTGHRADSASGAPDPPAAVQAHDSGHRAQDTHAAADRSRLPPRGREHGSQRAHGDGRPDGQGATQGGRASSRSARSRDAAAGDGRDGTSVSLSASDGRSRGSARSAAGSAHAASATSGGSGRGSRGGQGSGTGVGSDSLASGPTGGGERTGAAGEGGGRAAGDDVSPE